MNLGISYACYYYHLAPEFNRDGPDWDYTGRPKLYFSSIPVSVDPETALNWLIAHVGELGLSSVYVLGDHRWKDPGWWNPRWQSPEYVEQIRSLLRQHQVEWVAGYSGQWVSTGDTARDTVHDAIQQLQLCRRLGSRIMVTVCAGRHLYSHFNTDLLSVPEQIDRIVENFKRLAETAEKLGVTVAIENHMDYRAAEIAEIVTRVDSPRVRVNFDTGNPFSVCEEPVTAAEILAPYTAGVGLKDFRVLPATVDGPKMFSVPLGKGHVDLDRIMQILAERMPGFDDAPCDIEFSHVLPELDMEIWVRESLRYARARWGNWLSHAGVVDAFKEVN